MGYEVDDYMPESGRMIKEDNTITNVADIQDGVAKIDTDGGYYQGVIDVIHQAVHEQKMHTISHRENTISNGSLYILIVADADKDVHARIAYNGEGKTGLKSWVNSVVDVQGVEKIPFNRQTALGNLMDAKFYINPTFITKGDQRGDDFLGTGGNVAQRVGGTGSSDIETIVNAGTTLLIEVVNENATAYDLGVIMNVYERNKFE